MASPQKENGFTQIAHEILDEICRYTFNGAQLRIIMKVWRMTYGYHKKDNEFAIDFLVAVTGLSERAVKEAVKTLIDNNVLIVTKKATRSSSRKMLFNKNYEEWTIPKSGDPVEKQIDMFESDEVHESAPNSNEDQVHDCSPVEVHDPAPNSPDEVHDCTPTIYKDLKDKDLKDNKELTFDDFYSVYPRRVSRQAAEKAWNKLSKESSFNPELIIRNTKNYAETCALLKTEKNFILHPSTYLNQKRFEDYDEVDPEGLYKESPALPALSKFDQDKLRLQQMFEEEARREEDRDSEAVRSHPLQLPELRDDE